MVLSLMSSVEIPGWEDLGVAKPSGTGLLEWCGIINAADYFLGGGGVIVLGSTWHMD